MSQSPGHEDNEQLLTAAIALLESEMGTWGSLSMRLGDEYIDALKVVIATARQTVPPTP